MRFFGAQVLFVPEKTDLQKSKGGRRIGGERRDGPLSMYEAINLARQIASSLVRSQANCQDVLEYREMCLLLSSLFSLSLSLLLCYIRLCLFQLSAAISSASTNVQSINRLFTLVARDAADAPAQSLSLCVPGYRLSCRFCYLISSWNRFAVICRLMKYLLQAIF